MNANKFFVDCHVFDGNLQGTTTYLKGLYQELIKDKTKSFFLAAYNEKELQTVFGKHSNVTYLKYKSKNKFIRLLIDIPRLIKENDIGYAHFQYVVPPIKKCNYIVTIHDVLFLDFPKYFPFVYKIKNKFLFQKSIENSDIILTVSQYSKEQIQKHFKTTQVFITPNAVDPVFFEEYNKSEIVKIVKERYQIENYWVYTSRWEPRKNHDLLLKSFVENQYYKTFYLVFIGDKAITNHQYNSYYDSLDPSIQKKIKILNRVNFDELLLLIRGANLSIYPSIAEGFGIPPLESVAAQVPTICSNTTAMSDYNFMGDCLFNPLDISDIKDKISIGLNATKVAEKKDFVQHNYNWAIASEQFKKAIISFENL